MDFLVCDVIYAFLYLPLDYVLVIHIFLGTALVEYFVHFFKNVLRFMEKNLHWILPLWKLPRAWKKKWCIDIYLQRTRSARNQIQIYCVFSLRRHNSQIILKSDIKTRRSTSVGVSRYLGSK